MGKRARVKQREDEQLRGAGKPLFLGARDAMKFKADLSDVPRWLKNAAPRGRAIIVKRRKASKPQPSAEDCTDEALAGCLCSRRHQPARSLQVDLQRGLLGLGPQRLDPR